MTAPTDARECETCQQLKAVLCEVRDEMYDCPVRARDALREALKLPCPHLALAAELAEAWEVARAYHEDRRGAQRRAEDYITSAGHKLGELQWKYRAPKTLPEKYDSGEVCLALIDALQMGGVYGWPGDGTGCAEQIVRAFYERGRAQLEQAKSETRVAQAQLAAATEALRSIIQSTKDVHGNCSQYRKEVGATACTALAPSAGQAFVERVRREGREDAIRVVLAERHLHESVKDELVDDIRNLPAPARERAERTKETPNG